MTEQQLTRSTDFIGDMIAFKTSEEIDAMFADPKIEPHLRHCRFLEEHDVGPDDLEIEYIKSAAAGDENKLRALSVEIDYQANHAGEIRPFDPVELSDDSEYDGRDDELIQAIMNSKYKW